MARPGDVRHARLRFAVVFALVAGAALTLYSFPYAEHGIREDWFTRYLAAYARVAGWVLRLTNANVQVTGTDVVGNISLTVAKNCDAMDVNILFVAAIVAFPVGWRRRAIGIGAGVAVLALANIIRIVSLYYIGVRWPNRFELAHAEVWPFAMVALAVGAFLLWSRWVTTAEARLADADVPT
jgi:exosortase/archaeosortase family protein